MAKKPKQPSALIGRTFKLLESMQYSSGEPHFYAGQEVTVISRSSNNTYKVSTPDENIIEVQPEDWGLTDADMQAMLDKPAAPLDGISTEIAEQLEAINLYTDPALNVILEVDLDLIDDSPFQPRTHYPDDYIDGLGESMKAVGMISAMLVRPKPDGRYENVFGHCRKRGAKRGGLTKGPVIVRELTDAQSAQLQAVENLQRKDLDAFDEAMSFAAYISAHGCTKDEFCQRTGLSRTQVYNRLKLSGLLPAGQQALRDGLINAEVATKIARVPGEKQQAYALKIILDNSNKNPEEPDQVMTVRRANDYLREKFTLDLKKAIFDPADATLLSEENGKKLDADYAVACTVCPKRSGVDKILYVDLLGDQHQWSRTPGGENVCTDPECFDKKKTAHLKREQAALEAKGEVVIAGNKARQTISAEGNLKNGYIALKDVKAEITRISKQAKASGTEAPAVEIVTVQNPRDGKTIKAVKVATLQEAGGKVEAPETKGRSGKSDADEKAAQAKMALDNATHRAAYMQLRQKLAETPRSTFDLQMVVDFVFEQIDWDDRIFIAEELYQCDNPNILEARIDSMAPAELTQLLMDCLLVPNLEKTYPWAHQTPEAMLKAAKHYGIDLKAMRKQAQQAIKNPALAEPDAVEAGTEEEEKAEA